MDRGLQYGDGLFETIALVGGALQFWEQHIQRMQQAAGKLGLDFPGEAIYFQDVRQLCKASKHTDAVIKLMLTRGQGARGYRAPDKQTPTRIAMLSDWPGHTTDYSASGIQLCLCKHTVSVNPDLAGIKHLNRLDSVLARSEWHDEYEEGLMSDMDGNIIQGTMSNVFAVRGNTLYTPDLQHCGINGIIRQQVLDSAQDENIHVEICNLAAEDIYSMDEIFVTNSIIGLWPVTQIKDKAFLPAETTHALASNLQRRMLKNAKILA